MEKKLQDQGWYLSEKGLNHCIELCGQKNSDPAKIISVALLQDLRQIATKYLPENINSGHVKSIDGPVVVQLQKIRNVTAPMMNQESQGSPRMLKMNVTDGVTHCVAIEFEPIGCLKLSAVPGTKFRIVGKNIPVSHGVIFLLPKNLELLGGEAEKLKEKWSATRSSQSLKKSAKTRTDAPQFVEFNPDKYKRKTGVINKNQESTKPKYTNEAKNQNKRDDLRESSNAKPNGSPGTSTTSYQKGGNLDAREGVPQQKNVQKERYVDNQSKQGSAKYQSERVAQKTGGQTKDLKGFQKGGQTDGKDKDRKYDTGGEDSWKEGYKKGDKGYSKNETDNKRNDKPSRADGDSRKGSGYKNYERNDYKYERKDDKYERKDGKYERKDDKYERKDEKFKYERKDDKYERKDDRYGRKDDKFERKDDKFERKDDRYGRKDDKYERKDDKYEGKDDRYGKKDEKYERKDDKYERKQGKYEKKDDKYDTKDDIHERKDAKYVRKDDRYGRKDDNYDRKGDKYDRSNDKYDRKVYKYDKKDESDKKYDQKGNRYDDTYERKDGRRDDKYDRRGDRYDRGGSRYDRKDGGYERRDENYDNRDDNYDRRDDRYKRSDNDYRKGDKYNGGDRGYKGNDKSYKKGDQEDKNAEFKDKKETKGGQSKPNQMQTNRPGRKNFKEQDQQWKAQNKKDSEEYSSKSDGREQESRKSQDMSSTKKGQRRDDRSLKEDYEGSQLPHSVTRKGGGNGMSPSIVDHQTLTQPNFDQQMHYQHLQQPYYGHKQPAQPTLLGAPQPQSFSGFSPPGLAAAGHMQFMPHPNQQYMYPASYDQGGYHYPQNIYRQYPQQPLPNHTLEGSTPSSHTVPMHPLQEQSTHIRPHQFQRNFYP